MFRLKESRAVPIGLVQPGSKLMNLRSMLWLTFLWLFMAQLLCPSMLRAGCAKDTKALVSPSTSKIACVDARAAECRGDFEIADRLWWDAVRAAGKKDGNEADLADSLYGQSQFYTRTAEYEKAVSALKRFIQLKRSNREKTYFYLTLHDCELADLYYYQHKWKDAAELYLDIARVWKDSRRWPLLIPVYDRLGVCFQQMGKPDDADAQFQESLAIWRKASSLRGLEPQVLLMDFLAALSMEDYSAFQSSIGKEVESKTLRSQAESIWNKLNSSSRITSEEKKAPNHAAFVGAALKRSKVDVPPDVLKKVMLAETLAFYYCRTGRYFESENFYDSILSLLSKQLVSNEDAEPTLRQQVLIAICESQKACRKLVSPFAAKQGEENPYLVEFCKLRTREDFLSKRTALVSKFAYAVPTAEGLAALHKYQPIIEIGAGTGYWAASLRKRGTKIVAYELYPLSLGKNAWHPQATRSWTEVLRGDESMSAKFPKSTLFMSYPPGRTRVAYNALKGYQGNRLVYVGETAGLAPGRGQDDFQALLAKEWQLEKQINQPQWPGLYDCLYVYRRKSGEKPTVSPAKQ